MRKHCTAVFSAALVGSMMVCGAAKAATNLLIDPGFEASQGNVDATGGDQNQATGWVVFGNGYTTTAHAHTGTQGLKTFGQYNGAYQAFTGIAGHSYTATVYGYNASDDALSPGTVADLELNFFTDANGSGAYYNSVPVITGSSPTNTWIMAQITVTAPAGQNFIRVQLNQNTPNPGGAAFYDDVTLVDNTVASPEPASLGLIGLAGVGLLRRRRA